MKRSVMKLPLAHVYPKGDGIVAQQLLRLRQVTANKAGSSQGIPLLLGEAPGTALLSSAKLKVDRPLVLKCLARDT